MGADPLLGTEVGNYKLTHVLGEGGMGKVYVGEQARIASRVAIKVLSSQKPDLVKRFFAEAKAVNLIKHSAIVKVHDLGNLGDGRPYIVMELVEGETLRMLIVRDAPLSQGGIAKVMSQVLGALAAAHSVGIIHRDLKPDNIMVLPDGSAKVLDFGIAKLSPWLGQSLARTKEGMRIGTPAYMSPEQINGGAVDARSDVYAAGIVLFEALTGRRPFHADNEFDLMRGHLDKVPASPRELRKSVSVEMEQIVKRALAKKPAERFQTATAMASALDDAARQLPADQQRLLSTQPIKDTILDAPAVVIAPAPKKALPATILEKRRVGRVDSLAVTAVSEDEQGRRESAKRVRRERSKTMPVRAKRSRMTLVLMAAVIGVPILITGVVYFATRPDSSTVANKPITTPSKPAPIDPPIAPPIGEQPVGRAPSAIRTSKAADFGRDAFDFVGYAARAKDHARTVLPDAELFSMHVNNLRPDGSVVLAAQSTSVYTFVSPGAKSGSGLRLCTVTVHVSAAEIVIEALPQSDCSLTTSEAPTCTLPELVARARMKRSEPIVAATWISNTWQLSLEERRVQPVTLDDHCDEPKPKRVAPPPKPATPKPAKLKADPPKPSLKDPFEGCDTCLPRPD